MIFVCRGDGSITVLEYSRCLGGIVIRLLQLRRCKVLYNDVNKSGYEKSLARHKTGKT